MNSQLQLTRVFLYGEVFIESISIVCCLWYFVAYFRKRNPPIQLTFILILLISDLLFNLNLLFENLFPDFVWRFFDIHVFSTTFAVMFSIIWSTTISYIVYKSFLEYDFQPQKVFWKALAIILILVIFLLSA